MKKRFNLTGKIRWVLGAVIVLAIAGGGAFYYTSSTKASTPTETPVQTSTATRGNIVLYANGTGSLVAAKTANFGFGTSGQVTELDVKIGDTVEAGQVIGKMDDTEVKAAYEQAKRTVDDLTTPAALASAKQAVADAAVDIYNAKKETVGSLDLNDDLFGGRVKTDLIWEAVVHENASERRGTHATKNRALVSGSGKKPWRQKGTGRARVGEIRNPLWRKGGTVFGPQPRSYDFALPKKVKLGALRAAIAQKLNDKTLVVVDKLESAH